MRCCARRRGCEYKVDLFFYTSIGTSSTSRAGSAFLPLSHGSSASGGLVQLVSFVFLLT